MEFRRCQLPCAHFIAREDPHSKCIKCLGFSHARDAVYRTSKCKICDDFRLITLRSRLEDCEREFFPGTHRAPPRLLVRSRPLVKPRPGVRIFHPLWLLPGSPAPSFLPSRVGPLPLLSGSPTSRPVRQVWPFTQWPSFRPTRRTS